MMLRLLRRFAFQISLIVLTGLIGIGGLFVLVVVVPDLQAGNATASASPAASPTAPALAMSWINLPANADCAACHQTESGVGVRTVPKIAHPLRGWTDCTACHA